MDSDNEDPETPWSWVFLYKKIVLETVTKIPTLHSWNLKVQYCLHESP